MESRRLGERLDSPYTLAMRGLICLFGYVTILTCGYWEVIVHSSRILASVCSLRPCSHHYLRVVGILRSFAASRVIVPFASSCYLLGARNFHASVYRFDFWTWVHLVWLVPAVHRPGPRAWAERYCWSSEIGSWRLLGYYQSDVQSRIRETRSILPGMLYNSCMIISELLRCCPCAHAVRGACFDD